MEAVLSRLAWPVRSDASRAFQNWLLCWLLLPNLGFWLLWIVGGPPRAIEIAVIGLIGIVSHRMPYLVRMALFAMGVTYSILAFLSGLFNLHIKSLLFSLQLAGELNVGASAEYLAAFAVVIATFAAALRFQRRPLVLERPSLIIAAAAIVFGAAVVDSRMSGGKIGSYNRHAEAGALFTSATGRSGFDRIATGERHAMIVMVEAMGLPDNPELRARLVNLWARPEVRARYDVIVGDTLYYGSTTDGEVRELCGRWGDYFELLEAGDRSCLPARLAARGYHSQAWHSFSGHLFQRTTWYPKIGFEEMRFGEQLVADGAKTCPGVFPGACDRDVPVQIASALREARQPQFLYWLTVNSHLPVITDKALQTQHCERFDATLAAEFPMTCRLFMLFDQTGAALARQIAADDFPATDILIVGDHIPPFFDRHNRNQFAPDRVPWILLRPKAAARAAL